METEHSSKEEALSYRQISDKPGIWMREKASSEAVVWFCEIIVILVTFFLKIHLIAIIDY